METSRGSTDANIQAQAFNESRLLITEDKDFDELVYRLHQPARRIVLIRFDIQDRALKIPRLRQLVDQEADRLFGNLIILEPANVRIRPLA